MAKAAAPKSPAPKSPGKSPAAKSPAAKPPSADRPTAAKPAAAAPASRDQRGGAAAAKSAPSVKGAVSKSAGAQASVPAGGPKGPTKGAAKRDAANVPDVQGKAKSQTSSKATAEAAVATKPSAGKSTVRKAPSVDVAGGRGADAPKSKSAPKSPAARSATSSKAALSSKSAGGARSVAAAAAAVQQTDAEGYVIINGRRVRMISTKDIALPRKRKDADAKPVTEPAAIDVTTVKTKLSKKELEHYGQLLLTRRAEILGLVRGMEQEALRGEGGNLSHMPIHMADIGSDTAEQDFALNLAEKERETLAEIDAALQRVESGTYGVCQATGKPIPKARLDAKPWAKYTIEAARMFESGHRF